MREWTRLFHDHMCFHNQNRRNHDSEVPRGYLDCENTHDGEKVVLTLTFWRQTAPECESGRDFFTIICVFTIKIEEIMIPSAQEQGEAISSAREQGVAKLCSLATQNEIVMPSALVGWLVGWLLGSLSGVGGESEVPNSIYHNS